MAASGIRVLRHARRYKIQPQGCEHVVSDHGEMVPRLGMNHDGVVCMLCGLLLPWAQVAVYMRRYARGEG